MATFLQVPLKKTTQIDFVKPLSKYITNTFSGEVLNENKDSLAELNQLRGNAVVKSLDKHESSLEVIQRYEISLKLHLLCNNLFLLKYFF